MANDEVLKQYEEGGEDYIRNQRTFFADKEDWTRKKIRGVLKETTGKVLDIGCGAGDDIKWCEENGIEAYGIDPSEKMVGLAKNTVGHKDKVQVGEYEKIPFLDQTFDLVMGRFSLHYLKDFSLAYKETARVLKIGGKLMLIVSHPTFDSLTINKTKEELVSVKLYEGKVVVKFPPHKVGDYFSKQFLQNFDLQEVSESESIDADNLNKVPETLFYTATKRSQI